jgi:D-alanyl-D-alanine carboxypeptidase
MARRMVAATLAALAVATAPALAGSERAETARGFSPATTRALALAVRNDMTDARLPGAVVGVWIPGRGSWVRAFGIADRSTGAPIRAGDHVRIASITKTFTATAVLQLVDQGKLRLDDHLDAYVPGVANGGRITIRQLLDMTAGVFDYTSDARFAKAFYANLRMPFGPEQFFAILRRHRPAFAPGTAAHYSDSNYYLLGLVVQRVTGRPLEAVIRDQILRPLGLRHTSFPRTAALPRPFSRGYFGGADGTGPLTDATASNPAVSWAAGAMVSTLGDLRTWCTALVTGTLLSKATQAERLRIVPFSNPGPVKIGYGLGIFRIDRFLGHNGAIAGYSSAMFSLPSTGATMVVLANNSTNFSTATTTIFFDLARILLPSAT